MRDLKDIYLEMKKYEGQIEYVLIERLIPAKAMPEINSLTGKKEYNYWVCPNCNQTFAGMFDYCYHCGQALDWKNSVYDKE